MSFFGRISDLQLQLQSLEKKKSVNNSDDAIHEIHKIRDSLNALSDEIKSEMRYSTYEFSYKDRSKALSESNGFSESDEPDEETMAWLDENYGGNYKKTSVLLSPKRSPLERFRLLSKLLKSEVKECKKYGIDTKNIRGVGHARISFNSNSSLTSTEIALAVPRINKLLENCWDLDTFDIFELNSELAIRCHTLTVFCSYLARQFQWINSYHIPMDTFHNFLMSVERNYNDIPYHNQIHGADVTHTMMHFCKTSLFKKHMTTLDMLCSFIAAVIHDVGHTGQTNNYHINSSSFLAIRYNDKSVLENFHLSTAFSMLKDPKNDFLVNLTEKEKKYVRSTIIDMVLGTDLFFHQKQLKQLEKFVAISNNENKLKFKIFSLRDHDNIPRIHDVFNEKRFIMDIALHLSDISNPAKTISCSIEWTKRITQEFFEQGDMEKLQGLEISPMCDRKKNTNIAKQSIGFIDFIVFPMYNLFQSIEPEINIFVEGIKRTRKYWQEMYDENENYVFPTKPRRLSPSKMSQHQSSPSPSNTSTPLRTSLLSVKEEETEK